MAELALSRKYHRDSMFVGRFDNLGVTNGASGLDDRRDPGFGRLVEAIPEGERRRRSLRIDPLGS